MLEGTGLLVCNDYCLIWALIVWSPPFFYLSTYCLFRQEGWRLEHENPSDPQSPLIFKGVVFNEMKGAFVSVLPHFCCIIIISVKKSMYLYVACSCVSSGSNIPWCVWRACWCSPSTVFEVGSLVFHTRQSDP